MPVVQAGDIRIRYDVEGEGEDLILIRGFGLAGDLWRREFIDPLARRFRVITFDNRGTGGTDKPDASYSIPMMADDTAALLTALGVERAHVFGISMGGMIAQEVALNHPGRVRGLVLGCTHCGPAHAVPADPAVRGLLTPPPDLPPEEVIRRGWPASYSPSFIEANRDFLEARLRRQLQAPTPPYARAHQFGAIQRFGTYDRLPRIAAPTLVVAGSADRLIPPENSEILAQRIPGARLHIIQGAAHSFADEAPEEAARVIAEFLASLEPVER